MSIDITKVDTHIIGSAAGFDHQAVVHVIDSTETYLESMKSLFDFNALKAFVSRKDFNLLFDGMHGAAGPYAKRIFGDIFGID